MNIKEKLKTTIQVIGGLLIVLIIFSIGMKTMATAPDYAHVYVNESNSTYFAPPCIKVDSEILLYTKMTLTEARDKGYSSDEKCRESGAFAQDGRSVLGSYLEKWGILPEKEYRWNKDGSWKW